MRSYWREIFFGLVGASYLVAFFANTTSAQISMMPEMLVVEIKPSKMVEKEIRIKNEGKIAKEIWLTSEYRWQGACTQDIETWIRVEPKHFVLESGKTQKVSIEFKTLSKEMKGECHIVIFAQETIKSTMTLNIKVGMPIYIRLNPSANSQGNIVNVSCNPGKNRVRQVKAEVMNCGDLFLLPFGVTWLENNSGETIWQKEIHFKTPIAPGKSGNIDWDIPENCIKTSKQLQVHFFWGSLYSFDKFPIKNQKKSITIQ